jgi:hypothetical protein
MGSSFLTTINVGLALYCLIVFFKSVVQFGLPNRPSRFTLYLVMLCAVFYFSMKAVAGLSYLSPLDYLHWRPLPIVAGGLGLLLQVITTVGKFSHIQQKIISRVPLIGGLLVFSLLPIYAEQIFVLCILASVLFLTVSVGKVRYQKRMLMKMSLFLGVSFALTLVNSYVTYVVSELLLFPSLFYFFVFEQGCGVSTLVDKFVSEN